MTVNNKASTQLKKEFTNADRKRLGEFLLNRLTECGWKDQLEKVYEQIVEENKGKNVPDSIILAKLNARARPLIPESVKREFKAKIDACRGGPRVLTSPNAHNKLTRPIEKALRVQVNIHLMIKNLGKTNT